MMMKFYVLAGRIKGAASAMRMAAPDMQDKIAVEELKALSALVDTMTGNDGLKLMRFAAKGEDGK